MSRVILCGLEPRIAGQLEEVMRADGHEVSRVKKNAPIRSLVGADVILAGGEPSQYLPLLRRIRAIDGAVFVVIIARFPRTTDWLESLDAGASDYWQTPLDLMRVRGFISTLPSRPVRKAAGAGGFR